VGLEVDFAGLSYAFPKGAVLDKNWKLKGVETIYLLAGESVYMKRSSEM